MNEIEIYKTKDGKTEVEVRFDEDTVWLSQPQLVALFKSSKANVSEHLTSIFRTGELDKKSTVRKFRTVRPEGKRMVTRNTAYYSLDVIISIGYRINTKRGIQFRQWATQRLKDYLVKGFATNQKRLEQLQQTIRVISEAGKVSTLELKEAKGLLEIIGNYTGSFILLNQYDSHNLITDKLTKNIIYEINYEEARKAIDELCKELKKKKETSDLFGREKDNGFKSSLQSIVQTFEGKYLYASIEEQAGRIFCILSSRTILLLTGINVLVHFCLFGSWKKISTALKNPAK